MPYQFGYSVYHPPSYNDYGHQEKSDGKRVDGEYRVALPDGRTQIVTYYVEGDSGFQAKVRYEPTVNPPPTTPANKPYEGPSYEASRKPDYAPEPVYEPRKPVYAPEPTYEPRKPYYPAQEPAYVPKEAALYVPRPVYRPREPEYPSGRLVKKPLYVQNPVYSTDKPIENEEPSTIPPPVTDEPKLFPAPSVNEIRKPHDGYSPNAYTKPYSPKNDYPTTQTPYPQTYVPYAPREYPKPHDGYSARLYKQFQGDYGKKIQPHDGYSNEPKEEYVPTIPHDIYSHKAYNNERKEEYTPNLPHDGYSPKLYNQPKEEYVPKPYAKLHEGYTPKQYQVQEEYPAQEVYTPRPYQPEEYPSGRPLPHSGYAKSSYRTSSETRPEKYRDRPNYPRYHDGYSTEKYPHRELKQSVETGERKPHSGYSGNEVSEFRRPASEKRRRSPPKRVVRQRYVPITRRRVKEVKDSQVSSSQVTVTTVQPNQSTTNKQ